MNFSRNKIIYSFWVFIIFYLAVILIYPRLQPTDDFVFLRTLQSGKPILYYSQSFPYYDAKELGRFTPLVPMEYNLAWFFSSSPSPLWYYGFHALQFLVLIWASLKLFKLATESKYLPYLATGFLTLLPGFAIAFFRLQMNERNVLVYMALFLLSYFYFLKDQRSRYAVLCIFFANLVIYYKEVGFILIGTFSFAHLLLTWKMTNIKNRVLDFMLWSYSILYLLLYYLLVFSEKGRQYIPIYYNVYLVIAKNILNYAFFSDPLIFLIALPLTFYRMIQVFVKGEKAHPFYDTMLATIPVYIGAFIALKLYSPYYLLPTYIVAIPPILYYLKKIHYGSITKFLWLGLWMLTGFFIVVNNIPAGLHYISYQKYLGINFNKALDVITEQIPNNATSTKPTNIYLDGVDFGPGRGTYFVFAEFLNYRGLRSDRIDLRSNVKTLKPEALFGKISFPYTVFNSDIASEIKSGDYLVVSPQRTSNSNAQHLSDLQKDYNLILKTNSPFAFPNFTFKSLIKMVLSASLSRNQTSNGLIVNETIIEDPNYYIFVKK